MLIKYRACIQKLSQTLMPALAFSNGTTRKASHQSPSWKINSPTREKKRRLWISRSPTVKQCMVSARTGAARLKRHRRRSICGMLTGLRCSSGSRRSRKWPWRRGGRRRCSGDIGIWRSISGIQRIEIWKQGGSRSMGSGLPLIPRYKVGLLI